MTDPTRRLAAIMFTDIVGYTALMGEDEPTTLDLLTRKRGLLKPLVQRFRGEWLKEMGDGALSCFQSAVDAVTCALEIQRALKDDPTLQLRIGIHLGDVVFREGDVFGDGVNIASRIVALAEPGGICVSAEVYQSVRNQPGVDATSLGQQDLKHVNRPIEVFALGHPQGVASGSPRGRALRRRKIGAVGAFGGLGLVVVLIAGYLLRRSTPTALGPTALGPTAIRSLAVLPLENLSGDPEQAYFVDGMTDELITDLAKIGALRVISRTSIMHYKGSQKPLPEIARELNVDGVVEGTVLRAGGAVRITAQLIDARSDQHVWSESYERDLRDVLALQREVASAIARRIEARLTPDERTRLSGGQPVKPAAYEAALKGWHFLQNRTPETTRKSVQYFEHAVAEDPNYAPAYAGLATAYI